jgi:hypothetical protein
MTTVYILGAGFSHAISEHMPLMRDLSGQIRARLGGLELPGQDTALANDFERWLSFLIDTPPWLSSGEAFRAHAAAADITTALHDVLSAAQSATTASEPPAWLVDLVGMWHGAREPVITFNYDHLVELAWCTLPDSPKSVLDLYPAPIGPVWNRVAGVATSGHNPTLELMKLHGSLSWRYSGPSGPVGDPVYDIGIRDYFGRPPVDQSKIEFLHAHQQAMIIPPTAIKNQYYTNGILTGLWKRAAERLALADRIVLIGFSMPASDQIVASLLATTLRPQAIVIPVDTGSAVIDRLRDVLTRPDGALAVRTISEEFVGTSDAVERWVNQDA